MKGKVKIISGLLAVFAVFVIIFGSSTIINRTSVTNMQDNAQAPITYSSREQDFTITAEDGTILPFTVNGYFLNNGRKEDGIYCRIDEAGSSVYDTRVEYEISVTMTETNGHFKDAYITVPSGNYDIEPNAAEGAHIESIKYEYNTEKIKLSETMTQGADLKIPVTFKQRIYANGCIPDNYSRTNKAVFEGVFVEEDGSEFSFHQEIEYTIDWDTRIDHVSRYNIKTTTGNNFIANGNECMIVLYVNSGTGKDEGGWGIRYQWLYKLSNFKIGTVLPKSIEVYSAEPAGDTPMSVEDVKYNKTTDTLTYKVNHIRANGGFARDDGAAYVVIKYDKSALDALGSQKSATIQGITQIQAYVNPKIDHSDRTSIIDGSKPNAGSMYSETKSTTYELICNSYDGDIIRYNISASDGSKLNSAYYYHNFDVDAGFREIHEVDIIVPNVLSQLCIKYDYKDENGELKEKSFLNSETADHISMNDFTTYTGVFIGNSIWEMLGEDGYFKIIDDITGNVIEEITKEDTIEQKKLSNGTLTPHQGGYTYLFDNKDTYKRLRYETSQVKMVGRIEFHSIVKIHNNKMCKTAGNTAGKIDWDTFQNLSSIWVYGNAHYKIGANTEYETSTYQDWGNMEYVYGTLSAGLGPDTEINGTTQVTKNMSYGIYPGSYERWSNQNVVAGYYNPVVIIEFPSAIKNVTIKNLKIKDGSKGTNKIDSVSAGKVTTVTGADGEKHKRVQFNIKGKIKEGAEFSFDAIMTPDSQKIIDDTITSQICKGYIVNTFDGKYEKGHTIGDINMVWWAGSDNDIHDIDLDGDKTDKANYAYCTFNYTAPVGVATIVSVSDGSNIVESPEIMSVPKGVTQVDIINSYMNFSDNDISDFRYIGRIPYEENTSVHKGEDMNSEFNTELTGPITIPQSFKDLGTVTVLYSTLDKNLDGITSVDQFDKQNWEWRTESNVSDWSKIRSFMIKLDGVVPRKTSYDFTYTIRLPEEAEQSYGQKTYAANAYISTSNGTTDGPAGSGKVGIMFDTSTRIDMDLLKKDKDDNNVVLSGAEYKLYRKDGAQIYSEETKEYADSLDYQISNNSSNPTKIKGLFPDTEYVLEETTAPSGYKKQNILFKFNDQGVLDVIKGVEGFEGDMTSVSKSLSDTTYNVTIDIPEPRDVVGYSVQYYYQKDNGTYDTTPNVAIDGGTAEVGSTITRTDIELDPTKIEGRPAGNYTLDDETTNTTEKTDEELVIVVDETKNIFKVYFAKKYTVTYQKGDHGTFDDDVHPDLSYGVKTPDCTKNTETEHDAGYVFNGWKPTVEDTVTKDMTYVAQWVPDPNTKYSIQFYYQVDGNYKSTPDFTEDRTGTAFTTAKATETDKTPVAEKNEYVFDSTYVGNVLEKEIAANGSTVLKVYFKLNKATYRVQYWYEDTNGNYNQRADRPESTSREGIIKSTVSVETDDLKPLFTDYELSKTHDTTERSGEVKADNSLVLKVYFDLKEAKYSVEYYYQNPNKTYSTRADRPTSERKDKIGKTVNLTNADEDPIYEHYKLSTSNKGISSDTVKADGSTVLKVYFDLEEAPYRVEYYYENLNGEYNQKNERKPRSDKDLIGATVTVTNDDKNPVFDDYKLTTKPNKNIESGVVNADGTTALKLYFDLKEVNYKVRYFYLNDNGVYPNTPVSTINAGPVKVGTTITRNDVNLDPTKVQNAPAGKYLLDDEDSISTERTDSSLVIKVNEDSNIFNVYFTKGYTVTYKPGTKGTFETKSKEDIPHGTLTPLLINDKTHKPGYEFTGWLEEDTSTPLLQDGTISNTKVTHDITYVAQWKALDVQYKVEFYYQQDDGTYPATPYAVVNRIGTTDTPVSLAVPSKVNDFTVRVTDSKETNADISRPKTDRNYIYDTKANNIVQDDTVNGDGSTVLRVYFKQIPVKYNVDVVLKDTADNTLPRNEFTITRQRGTNTTVLWNNRAVNDNTEINEEGLIIDTYTYKITEDAAPNSRYVNVLNGKYILVTTEISNEGLVSIKNWGIYENDTLLAKTDVVYSYVDVNLDTPANADRAIKVKVINPVRFTVELTKVDTDGNSIANTGISINSSIIDGQNAIHKDEIVTESKDGLTITDNGLVSGATNKNGVIRYEETWVNANEYTYEITETNTAGNQYVNILDGYKVVVKVRVGADGTLTAVPQNGRNFVIVATASGKTVTDDLYKYVAIDVANNSLSAIIDGTGKVDVNITNPVKFNFNLSKLDSKGKKITGTRFAVNKDGNEIFNGNVTTDIEVAENPIDAGTYTYEIRELNAASSRYVNILNNRYVKLVLQVNANGRVDIVSQNGDNFKVFEESGAEVTNYDDVIKFIKVVTSVSNGVYTVDVNVTNPVQYDVDVETKDTANNFLGETGIVIQKEEKVLYNSNATSSVEVNETPAVAGTYNYYITQNTTKTDKYVNPLEGKFIKVTVTVSTDGNLTLDRAELYKGNIGYAGADLIDINSIKNYVTVAVDNSGDKSKLKVTIIDPVRYTVEVKKVDTEGNGVQNTAVTIKSGVVDAQDASHSEETEKTAESLNGIEISESGEVSGETDGTGIVKYEETWVNAAEYTYEITEDEPAGNQYVNVLDGFKVVVKVKVGADGKLTIVKQNNKDFAIVATAQGKTVTDDLYKYVKVSVDNDSLSAIIDHTGKLNVGITNPVRFKFDLEKKDSEGNELKGTTFTVTRKDNNEVKFNGEVSDGEVEVVEDPIDAGTYTYLIRETAAATAKYENILKNRYIQINLKVNGNGHIDILDQGENNFKVFDSLGAEITDRANVLKFIEVWSEVGTTGDQKDIETVKVRIVNPVRYKVNITTATTAYDEEKDISDYFLDKTDVIVNRNETNIYSAQPTKDIEVVETPITAGEYEYYFTQTTTKSDKFVNPLENKFVKVTVAVSPNGTLEIRKTELFEGTIGDEHNKRLTNDDAEKYVKVSVSNPSDAESMLNILIIDPVRFTVEVKKVDTDNKPVENTQITINSAIVDEQDATHKDEVIETSESKDGIEITNDGDVAGTTNNDGVVKFEETWVESNESSNIATENKKFYTYEITEDEPAGNQYVNVLEGYKVIVRVNVDPNGNITLVDKDGRAYSKNTKYKYTIVKKSDGSEVPTTDIAYEYVTISVESNSVNAIIKGTDELKVNVTNPVRFDFDINKKSTDGLPLAGTKFTVTREGKDTPIFEGEPNEEIEIKEDPINSGIYTYLIRENQTNKAFGNRYVNVLEGRYIKLRVKVNANGIIDIVNNNNKTDNNDYFEVYEESGKQVTDDDVLRYISVSSTDLDGDGVYKLDVNVTNPVRYEIDIITKDTLNQFLNGVNVSLYKLVKEEHRDLYTGEATDVEVAKEVEKLEIPADAGTYTYYVKENHAPTQRYINVLENKYIEIKLTVAPNGMLTESHKLYEGEIGKGKEITTGEVLERYSVVADNSGDVSRLNITIVNPVRFIVEVDKYDTADTPLTNTTFEIESPIIEDQAYEHNNEKINGIDDDGITADGVVTGKTDNAIEKSKDGNMQRARISYEETWVDANDGKGYYTYYIRETKTAGAQYVNMLEGHKVVVRARVGADGTLTLVDKNGNAYAKDAEYKFTIETEDGQEIADTNNEMYKYVNISASNNKILATMNASIVNPVRYNIAVYETIYGDEKVKLNNIPVEVQSEFSGDTTLITGSKEECDGFDYMEERAVWADTYEYRIFQLNEFNGNKVEDEFVNMLDGYYIGIDLYVPGNGDIKTISKDGDYTTVSYKLYKQTASGEYAEIDFNDTIVDDFVKVKITKDENNVCTLNVYIVTPEKYDFRLEKTDIDVLYSVNTYKEKYPEVSPNMNDVEFTVTVKDANGEIVLKDTKSGKDAKSEFATINTKSQLTKNVKGVDGILDFNNILIERTGTYTFEIEEITPKVEGMIYKDKSEPIILTADIVVKDGKYVLENMQTKQADRYTIKENTKLSGDETQTVNVNVTNERIKGKYDLDLNKVNKFTGLPLDGAVYKVTVEQEGKEEKVLYLSNDDVLSMEQLIAYEEEESTSVNGTTSFKDIRIELPETYTIKIEEVKAPVIETEDGKKITFTKLDDVIELEVTTAIEGEYDDAHYVLGEIKLKEGNHDLISEEHSAKEEEKQNIQLRIENEYFDLALRQYVVDVNGTKFERKLDVNTDKLQSAEATDAEYTLNKEPQRAYAGQEVIYAIEVFNEGIIDGYAEEIMQYLPEGLEFVDDEFNKLFGWELNEDNTGVVTHALSKKTNEEENLIAAYNKDAENETDRLSSKVIYLKLKVKDNVKLKSILTTVAEVTEYLANDRKESVDRDSYDLITLPIGNDLVEYAENQEDDDDFEKLIIEEFDLAPVKFAKSVNGKEQNDRAPVEQLDETRADEYRQGIFNGFKYKNENEMLKLDQNDKIVYGIQVRNEGSVGSYATEVMDTIPSGLKFDKDSEINKKYDWKLLDADKNPTDDAQKAAYVVTDYLSEAKGKVDEETGKNSNWLAPLTLEGSDLIIDFKELEVEFIVTEPTSKDRIVKNIATIVKFIDDLGINVKDRDPEERRPDNIEKIYVNIFDLELEQVINSVEVTNTKTNEVTVMNGEEIRKLAKVDIAKSKLKNTNIKVEYKITIKNDGESAGYATELKDYIPEGFIFDGNDNTNWVANDGYVTTDALSNELLNLGDSREVTLVLRWNGSANVGVKENLSEISKHADKNKLDIVDWDSTPDNKVLEEDDIDYTAIILTIKTGSAEIAIMSIAIGFMVVTSLGIIAYNKRKNS